MFFCRGVARRCASYLHNLSLGANLECGGLPPLLQPQALSTNPNSSPTHTPNATPLFSLLVFLFSAFPLRSPRYSFLSFFPSSSVKIPFSLSPFSLRPLC